MGKQVKEVSHKKNILSKAKKLKQLITGKVDATPQNEAYPYGSQSLVPIKCLKDGLIYTSDGRYVKILEILPTNFYLKTEAEQQNIIYYFSSYLKVAPPNTQILIRTQRADIDAYCAQMEEYYNLETNPSCRDMILEDAEMVNYLANYEAVTYRFYIIFDYTGASTNPDDIAKEMSAQADTAYQYLDYCGLEVKRQEYYDDFHLRLLYSIYNKQTSKTLNLDSLSDQLSAICCNPDISTSELAEQEHQGMLTLKDLLSPTQIDLMHKDYLLIDGVYHSYLYLSGYGYPTSKLGLAWLSPLVGMGDGISLSFFLNRKRKEQIIPKVSKTTMLNRSRIRDVGDTRSDYEELDDAINSGIYIKDQLNRANEDFFYMETLVEVTAYDLESLTSKIRQVETLCASMDMIARRADYKQEQCFLSMLPLNKLDSDIESKAKRNILTSGAAAAFPFTSYELCDDKGIFLGINLHNNSNVIIDMFNSNLYLNGNLVVFGTSGAGKTFFCLLLAMRLRMAGVRVIIIAPEKGFEYRDACRAIGGKYIRLAPGSQDCINIMEIRKATLDIDNDLSTSSSRNDSVLMDKINHLRIGLSLLCSNLTPEERYYLDTAVIECYHSFGFTADNNSLLQGNGDFKPMPDYTDLIPFLEQYPILKNVTMTLQRLIRSGLAGQTNVDLNSQFTVIDISDIGNEFLPYGIFIATELVKDEISRSRVTKNAVFGDEIWKISSIEGKGNEQATNFIIEVIKTIRGYGGIFVTATQNTIDCFALQGGKFGDALLGNSRLKLILQAEEAEALKLKEKLGLSNEETAQLTRFDRGQGLLIAGKNKIAVEVRASQTEYDLITTNRADLEKRKASE